MYTTSCVRRSLLIGTWLAALAVIPVVAQQPRFPYPTERDFRDVAPDNPTPQWRGLPLGDGPFVFETLEQRDIRVVVMAKGLAQPRSLALLPDGAILVTERAGRLRVVRDGVLAPEPIAGVPKVVSRGTMPGLESIALHPNFAENRWIYISYHKPVYGNLGNIAIVRGTWDGRALTDVRDIFVSDDVDTGVSRLAFGRDGMLYMTIGGPATGQEASLIRAQHSNDHAGKVIRLRDDGRVPPDNPFVGRPGYKPEIYTIGHRNQLGLAVNPYTGELWATEQGPNGGDEVNILRAGRNYGWPLVSDGRDYRGPFISASPYREGMERPHILWVPSIAATGMTFYTGDRFPAWRRNLFVGGTREGEVPRTGQLIRIVFTEQWDELRREPLLRQLGQRIKDVQEGPDGLLYVITGEAEAALIRIEPVAPGGASNASDSK